MARSDFFHINCMAYMRELPDNFFSLAICDPPYGIGIARNPFRQKFERQEWDDAVPDEEFFRELFRVSKNQVIWGGNYFSLPPNKHFIIWDKCQPFDFSSAQCEYAWSSFDSPAKIFRYRVTEDKGKIHPTQKPVALYGWILEHYAVEGDIIFDPMAGSASSRIAAYKLGFDYVGCEINEVYYNDASERFARECLGEYRLNGGVIVKQTSIFDVDTV